jgi:hypothetical protein
MEAFYEEDDREAREEYKKAHPLMTVVQQRALNAVPPSLAALADRYVVFTGDVCDVCKAKVNVPWPLATHMNQSAAQDQRFDPGWLCGCGAWNTHRPREEGAALVWGAPKYGPNARVLRKNKVRRGRVVIADPNRPIDKVIEARAALAKAREEAAAEEAAEAEARAATEADDLAAAQAGGIVYRSPNLPPRPPPEPAKVEAAKADLAQAEAEANAEAEAKAANDAEAKAEAAAKK